MCYQCAGLLMVNSLQNGITYLFKGIYKNLVKCTCIPGHTFPPGSLRLSLVIVVMVGAQLFISVSISRAVISLLLMTSGDVERNPGPTQSSGMLQYPTSWIHMSYVRFWRCFNHCRIWSHSYSLLSSTIPISNQFHWLYYGKILVPRFVHVYQYYIHCLRCKFSYAYHALIINWHTVIKITGTTFSATVLLVLLLQAMTAVQTTLLMRSGDVEMNPGPGLYSGV